MADTTYVEESILKSIKKLIGPAEDYDYFDPDLIIHINMAFSTLNQLGVNINTTFRITGETETWRDYLNDSPQYLDMVKEYVYLKCKLIFDPPTSSFVLNAYQDTIKELEYRINISVDPSETMTEDDDQ